jgi:hypothetical protein
MERRRELQKWEQRKEGGKEERVGKQEEKQ